MMRKLLSFSLIFLFLLTGCGKKNITTKETIVNQFTTVCKTSDTAVMRNGLSDLKELCDDQNISEEDRMLAKYSYNVLYGIVKLSLSGKSISVFDFPEIEILAAVIGEAAKNDIPITNENIKTSEEFLTKVENFLK